MLPAPHHRSVIAHASIHSIARWKLSREKVKQCVQTIALTTFSTPKFFYHFSICVSFLNLVDRMIYIFAILVIFEIKNEPAPPWWNHFTFPNVEHFLDRKRSKVGWFYNCRQIFCCCILQL